MRSLLLEFQLTPRFPSGCTTFVRLEGFAVRLRLRTRSCDLLQLQAYELTLGLHAALLTHERRQTVSPSSTTPPLSRQHRQRRSKSSSRYTKCRHEDETETYERALEGPYRRTDLDSALSAGLSGLDRYLTLRLKTSVNRLNDTRSRDLCQIEPQS